MTLLLVFLDVFKAKLLYLKLYILKYGKFYSTKTSDFCCKHFLSDFNLLKYFYKIIKIFGISIIFHLKTINFTEKRKICLF